MNKKDENNRIETLLAYILLNSMKEKGIADKALQLSLAGFNNVEIADLLDITTGSVGTHLYEKRKAKKKKK